MVVEITREGSPTCFQLHLSHLGTVVLRSDVTATIFFFAVHFFVRLLFEGGGDFT